MFWKTDAEISYRTSATAEPTTIKIDFPASQVYAESAEDAKWLVRESLSTILAPQILSNPAFEVTVNAWYDHV